jgi:hypothetical protein
MTRKSSPLTNNRAAYSPPPTSNDEGVKLHLGCTVPPPPPGDIEASVLTIIGGAPVAVNATASDEGFTPVSRTMGFKTTPICLAMATITAPLTTSHANKEGYNFFESSEEEDSPPLLPNQPAVTMTHDKDLAVLMAASAQAKHRRTLAFIQEAGKVDQISQRAETLMEKTRLVAEFMSTTMAAFMARMDGMDANLVTIKCLLEDSMASSSKLAAKSTAAMKMLLAQAVAFNKQWFKQGQAEFHRVQDVENLIVDFKSASATVTCALEELVPKTLQSVLEQSIPPTLQMILGETISPMLRNLLDGTFSKFTSRYESMGSAVVRKVKATLEMQQESLATDYSLVQSSLQEVLTRLRALDQTIDSPPPNHPDSGGARNPTRSNPTFSDHGGDQVGLPGAWEDKQLHDNVRPTCDGNFGMDVDPRGSTDDVNDRPTEDVDPRRSTSPTQHPQFPNNRMEDFNSSHRGVNS